MSIEGQFTREWALEKVMSYLNFSQNAMPVVQSARAGHAGQKGTSQSVIEASSSPSPTGRFINLLSSCHPS